jgi:hypothetical protein
MPYHLADAEFGYAGFHGQGGGPPLTVAPDRNSQKLQKAGAAFRLSYLLNETIANDHLTRACIPFGPNLVPDFNLEPDAVPDCAARDTLKPLA